MPRAILRRIDRVSYVSFPTASGTGTVITGGCGDPVRNSDAGFA